MTRMLALLALSLLSLTANADKEAFTPNDLVMMERVSSPQLSPNGKEVIYLVRETFLAENKGKRRIWLHSLRNGQNRPLTRFDSNAASPRWSADGNAVYFLSAMGGSMQVWRLDLRGGEAQPVTDLPLDVGGFVLSPTGKQIAVFMDSYLDCPDLKCTVARNEQASKEQATGRAYDALFLRHWDQWKNGQRSQLFAQALDDRGIATGDVLHLSRGLNADVPTKPFGGDEELSYTPDGAHLYFSARLASASEAWSTNVDIFRVPADGSQPPRNLTEANLALDTQPRVSPDGKQLAWLAHSRPGFESDRLRLMVGDLDAANAREIAPEWDRSPHALQWDDRGRNLIVTANEIGQHPLFSVAIKDGRVRRLTEAGDVGGYAVHADRIVYAHDTLDRPAELFSITPRGGTPKRVSRHTDKRLERIAFGDYEQFEFEGAGGDTVYGYVMKPARYQEGGKYPVAFLIHGGPQGSFGNHFHYRWNPQFYAGAGYAVVFIDFHGSTGYGQAFTDSISGDWGGKPLVDLQKGWAAALEKYSFLNGDKACALGASYGGFMINWIAGQWPDAFDCLVNHDGLFDMRSFYYSTEELWFPEWEFGGPEFRTPETYERFNPVRFVDRWKTPMLVVHGSQDFRVPVEQGLAAYTALKRQGIPARFLHFPDENHFVLKPHNSLQWHQEVKDWLDRWTR